MKRDKFFAFLKTKGFYVSLFAGICAVFVLAMVYANVTSLQKQNESNLEDYIETVPPKVAETNPVGEGAIDVETGENKPPQTVVQKPQEDEVQDPDQVAKAGDDEPDAQETSDTDVTPEADGNHVELESEYGVGEDSEAVSSVRDSQNAIQNLKFNEEDGLLWPVEGNIIKHYSVEKLAYFDTLGQYKVNPAVMIDAAPGTDVTCAAKGIVTAISESDDLGTTLLMDIGNGYQIKYGQLSDVAVSVGDIVEEGVNLAKVAEPTIYYSVEGSNLYLQVLEDGETVNPLLLLR